jgi:hypothetical protein
MLVRIMAVVLLAASYATAAHAEEEGIANVPDRAVEQRDAERLADSAALEAGGKLDLPEDAPPLDLPEDPPIPSPRPRPAPKPAPVPAVRAVWDRLAACESSGNWASRSNPIYKGGLQFDAATWARHGGLAYAWRADYATREQQIDVAERTLEAQGWGAWPNCSRRLGLR